MLGQDCHHRYPSKISASNFRCRQASQRLLQGHLCAETNRYALPLYFFFFFFELSEHLLIFNECPLFQFAPPPIHVGGVLVFSANAIIYIEQSSAGSGIAVNGFAAKSTDFSLGASLFYFFIFFFVSYSLTFFFLRPSSDKSDLRIALEGSRHVFLTPERLLLALKDGDL
jgi:hypothetical protein